MPINHITHGMSKTRLYRCYRDMRSRCDGLKKHDVKNYFGRGINYCAEWKTFEPFMEWALSNGYDDNLTLDRINNDAGYSPSNCRWVTRTVQNNNTRQNRNITYNGETHNLEEWAKILRINRHTLQSRLDLYKWSVEKAFTTAVCKGSETKCDISS